MAQGSGTITALNGTVSAQTEGYSSISFNITGTWSADIIIEATNDDQNWFTVTGISPQTINVFSIFASNLQVVVSCGGYSQVRLRAYVFSSGTINITYDISPGENIDLNVIQGNVTATPPSYATGSVAQLSLTTAGALRAQDLKDAGRTYVTFTADAVAGVTSETLMSMTQNRQGSTTASQTNYTITNGKTLRIQALIVGIQAGAAAGEWVRVKIRHNTAGATTTSSSLVVTSACGTANATTATSGQLSVDIPDGLEFYGNGTQTLGITHISSATTNVESVTVCGYEY